MRLSITHERRALRLLGAAVATTVVVGATVVSPIGASAPTWMISPSPNAHGPAVASLATVACPSPTMCMAVGENESERWNGSTWSTAPTAVPGELITDALDCANPTVCFAGGESLAGKSTLERWNGTAWSAVSFPRPPAEHFGRITAIACATSAYCVAVGTHEDAKGAGHPFSEVWKGATWKEVPIADEGVDETFVSSIACPASTTCFAVGISGDLKAPTLVERWNGTSWTRQTSPNLSPIDRLDAIACTSTSACTAVGSTNPRALVERWNGSTWSAHAVVAPHGKSYLEFHTISCPSATSCTALATADTTQVVERWNGSTWAAGSIPSIPSGYGDLACFSTTNCFAVGYTYVDLGETETPIAQIVRWNGSTWRRTGAMSGTFDVLLGTACMGGSNCVAVGDAVGASGARFAQTQHWNGTAWKITPTPEPAGTTYSWLNAVKCQNSSTCIAVGGFERGTTIETLAERWNGSAWTILPSPNPAGAKAWFDALKCTSSTSCFAVGASSKAYMKSTLVEYWNGSAWTIVASPNPPGATSSELDGVACPRPKSCFATGISDNKALLEHWNGTAWTTVSTPTPAGGEFEQIACWGPALCLVVGYIADSFASRTLAERWNGAKWSMLSTPNPPGALGAGLVDIACVSTSDCTAVGAYASVIAVNTVVEHWNGSAWAIVPSPNPSGMGFAELNAVACPSSTECIAAGDYHADYQQYSLVERDG